MNVADQTIEIAGVPHFLARSATSTTAGVLLIPHVYGIDSFCQEFSTELAGLGLTTLVWNPYPQLPMGAAFEAANRPQRPSDEAAMASLAACIDVMSSDLGLKTFGTLGFCMGGRWVLLFGAREPRLSAAVACYPSVPAQHGAEQTMEPVPASAGIACPVMVVYPGQDRVTPRPVFRAMQAMLEGREAATTILYYPNAEHGFMHSTGDANEAATRTARPQVTAFLEAQLLL